MFVKNDRKKNQYLIPPGKCSARLLDQLIGYFRHGAARDSMYSIAGRPVLATLASVRIRGGDDCLTPPFLNATDQDTFPGADVEKCEDTRLCLQGII
jgi:hypothetical protein